MRKWWLGAEILRELVEELHLLGREVERVGLLGLHHRLDLVLAGHRLDGGASLDVGDEQGECLVNPVAPGRDRAAVHTAGVIPAGHGQFGGAAADGLLRILVRVIKARRVGADGESPGHDGATGGDEPLFHFPLADGCAEPCDEHRRHDEEEIIGHLRVVALQLQGAEERREGRAGQVFAAVEQGQAADGRRDVGQGDELPYVPGPYQDYEIRREAPGDGAEQGLMPFEPHAHAHYEEAYHHGEEQVGRRRKPQHVGLSDPGEHAVGRI